MKRIKYFLFGLAASLGVSAAIAAGIKHTIRSDEMLLGIGTSGDDKQLEFDTGDGAANKKLIIDGTTKNGSLNVNELTMGDAAASDKKIILDIGGSNPEIRWDNTASKLQFSNDGTNFKNIGSGGGSGGVNLLIDSNFDFEAGTANWTASGGTFTAETVSPLFDVQSGKWDSSALSQTLDSDTITVPVGLQGAECEAEAYYSYEVGSSGDYKLQAIKDGSTVLAEVDVDATVGVVQRSSILFTCPSSGTVKMRLESQVADADPITVDNTYLGSLRAVRGSSAEFVGSVAWQPTASCSWSSSSGTFADFAADADCDDNALTYKGRATPEASIPGQLPQIHFDSLAPGRYVVKAIGAIRSLASSSAAVRGFWRFHDGTSAWDGISASQMQNVNTGSIFLNEAEISGEFVYTAAQGSTAIRIQHDTDSTSGDIDATLAGLYISLYRFPLDIESSVQFDQADWHIDANIGGADIDLGTSSVATYQGMDNAGLDLVVNAGSHGAQIACDGTEEAAGLTCSGNEQNGIAFTIPYAGKYKACASFTHESDVGGGAATGGLETTFQIVHTPNNAQTITSSGNVRTESGHKSANVNQQSVTYDPHRLCGYFEFSSAGKKTLRLFYEQEVTPTVAASAVLADRAAAKGDIDIHWTVEPLVKNRGGISFDNAVASTDQSGVRLTSAFITDVAGTPTLTREDGNWISGAPIDLGVGKVQLNINASIFSAAPNCTCTSDPSRLCSIDRTSESATRVDLDLRDQAGSPSDEDFTVICVGPK